MVENLSEGDQRKRSLPRKICKKYSAEKNLRRNYLLEIPENNPVDRHIHPENQKLCPECRVYSDLFLSVIFAFSKTEESILKPDSKPDSEPV
jgi:hypothetical protein